MNEEHSNHPVDPNLEARIFSLVMDEVSEGERKQLSDLIQDNPELAAIQAEFESVRGLMQCVGTSELPPADDDEWKLSPERRKVVLAAFRGESRHEPATQPSTKPVILSAFLVGDSRWSLVRIAAAVCGVGVFGLMAVSVLLMLPNSRMATTKAQRVTEFGTGALLESAPNDVTRFGRASGANRMTQHEGDSSNDFAIAGALASEQPHDSATNLESSLSQIRDNIEATTSLPAQEDRKDDAPYPPAEPRWEQASQIAAASPPSPSFFGAPIQNPAPVAGEPNLNFRFQVPLVALNSPTAGKETDVRDMDNSGGGQRNNRWMDPAQPNLTIPEESKKLQTSVADGVDADIALGLSVAPQSVPMSLPQEFDKPSGLTDALTRNRELSRTKDETLDTVGKSQAESQLALKGWGYMGKGAELSIAKNESESIRISPARKVTPSEGLNEVLATDEAFSTFSLHVSDVSFKLASAALARGEWPEPAKVRIEEFVNAFDYGDPMPSESERVACRVEQAVHPFLQQRNLLRVSMRTAAAGRAANTPLRLTFLLDNSGSMERHDRQQTLRRAFALLAQQLTPLDQMTLISFARQPRLLADKVSGEKSGQLVELIDGLPSEGGTNIEAAIQLAFEKARENQLEGAQNRIVLLTDGAVNLGDADPETLSNMIATIRDSGIAFDAAGISAEGLNDEVLEALTRKGDGRYYLLDSLESADEGFAQQIAGALRPSAKNVKVQVEFNPKRVGQYKLLGFEKHLLQKEDFRNDKVDAAEMAAAEAGVAVYQFEAIPDGEGDVGTVSVRFRDLASGHMVENRWPIPYETDAPRLDQANVSIRMAASSALFAAKLRGEPLGDAVNLTELSELVSDLPEPERSVPRVQQLQQMLEQARQISGE